MIKKKLLKIIEEDKTLREKEKKDIIMLIEDIEGEENLKAFLKLLGIGVKETNT